jgi:peptide maturation system protein (TIGR04066 family)
MSIPVAIYPFCAEILPVVKTFEKLQDLYSINCLISPSGFGLTGRDAGYICNHPDIGIVVTDEFIYDDVEWTTLILIEPIMIKEKVDYSYEVIAEQAVLHGKHVIFLSASEKVNDKINELSDLYFDKIKIGSYKKSSDKFLKKGQKFHDVEVPVVLVGGLLEEADNFEVLLKIAVKMKSENVNALVFTKHSIGELLGFHNMNHIWNCSNYSEAQKINEINYYINNMVEKERPEVILLEAPDAVMRYNDYAVNGFGIRTYMLCQAVTPDRFVCCVPFELACGNFLSAISLGLEKTLGTSITSVHASNILMNPQELMQKRDISFIHSDLKFVREQLLKEREHSQIPIYNVVMDGINELYNDLFENEY